MAIDYMERVGKMMLLRDGGMTLKEIGQEMGVSRSGAGRILREQMEGERRKRQARDEQIITAYQNNETVKSISKLFGLGAIRIYAILRENDIRSYNTLSTTMQRIRDREIVLGLLGGDTQKGMAEKHGITPHRVNTILREQGQTVDKRAGWEDRYRVVNDMYDAGNTRTEIKEKTGLPFATIGRALRKQGKYWTPIMTDCVICGNQFEQTAISNKICSGECRDENIRRIGNKSKRDDIGKWLTCLYCDKPFKVYNSDKSTRKYCNHECSANAQFEKNELRNKEIFYLRHVQGMVFRRIGEIMNVSTSTARAMYRNQKLVRNLRLAELGID